MHFLFWKWNIRKTFFTFHDSVLNHCNKVYVFQCLILRLDNKLYVSQISQNLYLAKNNYNSLLVKIGQYFLHEREDPIFVNATAIIESNYKQTYLCLNELNTREMYFSYVRTCRKKIIVKSLSHFSVQTRIRFTENAQNLPERWQCGELQKVLWDFLL